MTDSVGVGVGVCCSLRVRRAGGHSTVNSRQSRAHAAHPDLRSHIQVSRQQRQLQLLSSLCLCLLLDVSVSYVTLDEFSCVFVGMRLLRLLQRRDGARQQGDICPPS